MLPLTQFSLLSHNTKWEFGTDETVLLAAEGTIAAINNTYDYGHVSVVLQNMLHLYLMLIRN